MDQHRSAEADDELRQEQLEDEHDSEPGSIGEFLRAHWISVSVAALVLIAAVAAGIIWVAACAALRVDRRRFYRFTAVCRQH